MKKISRMILFFFIVGCLPKEVETPKTNLELGFGEIPFEKIEPLPCSKIIRLDTLEKDKFSNNDPCNTF